MIGNVYAFVGCIAVVTEGPGETRQKGSTRPWADVQLGLPDFPVYTLLVLHDSGKVMYPVERRVNDLSEYRWKSRLIV